MKGVNFKNQTDRGGHLMQGTNWVKVSDGLPNDYTVVLTKSDGANVRSIFFHDEAKNPTFIHISRNGKVRNLDNVTKWRLPPMPEGE